MCPGGQPAAGPRSGRSVGGRVDPADDLGVGHPDAAPAPPCDFGTFTVPAEDEISLTMLAMKQKAYDEKVIRTRGFIQLEFEAHHLVATRWDLRVWFQNAVVYRPVLKLEAPWCDSARACTRRDVSVEGVFGDSTDGNGRIIGRFNSGVIHITAIRELRPETFRMPEDERP